MGERVRAYLRAAAAEGAGALAAPPFVVFARPAEDTPVRAVVDRPLRGDLGAALARLRSAAPGGPRQITVAAFADDLAATDETLAACGLVDIERVALLVATPDTLRPAPAVPGLAIAILDADADLAAVRENLDANERGFDPLAAPTTAEAAASFRAAIRGNRAFTAHLAGRSVGAGMFTPPRAGVAELVGITTLAAYRRRGIATALTAVAARTAFALGCDIVFLRAQTDEARRIYERLGFCYTTTVVDACLPLGVDER